MLTVTAARPLCSASSSGSHGAPPFVSMCHSSSQPPNLKGPSESEGGIRAMKQRRDRHMADGACCQTPSNREALFSVLRLSSTLPFRVDGL